MKRFLAVLIATLGLVLGAVMPTAHAWTWSSAKYPAGSVSACGPTSGGGLMLLGGFYMVPGAAHVEPTPGQNVWECADGSHISGFFGHVTETQWNGSFDYTNDLALTTTGSDPIPPYVRVSAGWVNAPIQSYSNGTDLPAGAWACETGFSTQTAAAGGYRCGQFNWSCTRSALTCQVFNSNGIVANGDSGALVWWYGTNGVELLGIANGGYCTGNCYAPDGSYTGMTFTPFWRFQDISWTTAQTWTAQGFQPYNGATGCFVTVSGCVHI